MAITGVPQGQVPFNPFGDTEFINWLRGGLGRPTFEKSYNISTPATAISSSPGRDESGSFVGLGRFDQFSPEVGQFGQDLIRAGNEGFNRQQQAFKEAAGTVRGAGESIEDLFASFNTRLSELLPDKPFSDEQFSSRVGGLTGRLNEEERRLLQEAQNAAVRRGFGAGDSMTTQAATDIRLGKIGAKQEGIESLIGERDEVNQAMAKFKAGIEAGLTIEQAGNLAKIGLAEGGVQMTGALAQEPTFIADAMADLFGVEKAQELDAMVQEALESNDPDALDRILEALGSWLNSQGNIGGGLFADLVGGN